MDERTTLLRAILANPKDDTARLVFADWLQEHGEDDLAELIRIEMERDSLPRQDPASVEEYSARDADSARLWEANRARWLGPAADSSMSLTSSKGFIRLIDATADEFLTHADWLFDRHPIEGLVLRDVSGHAVRLSACRHLGRITTLGFHWESGIGGGEAVAMFSSPHLGKLRVLHSSEDRIGPEGCRTIGENPVINGLNRLALFDSGIADEGVSHLLESGKLVTVRWLSLSRQGLTDETLVRLASNQDMTRLESLRLAGNQIGARGLSALARGQHLTDLSDLNLSGNPIGPDGIRAIEGRPILARLRSLSLGHESLSGADIARLLCSATFPRLESLTITSVRLNRGGTRSLAGTLDRLRHLERFSCSFAELNARGVEELIRWPGLSRLRTLRLGHNPIGDEGVVALVRRIKHATSLRQLDLGSCAIGDRGVAALARHSAKFSALRELDLSFNAIDDEGAFELSNPDVFPGLRSLGLDLSRLGDEAYRALTDRFGRRVRHALLVGRDFTTWRC